MSRPGPAAVEDLLRRLAADLGPRAVITDPDRTASYVTDWTARFRGRTPGVVRPGSVE